MNNQNDAPRTGQGEDLPLVARRAVQEYLTGTDSLDEELPSGYQAQRRGVFVTVRTRDGQLRGCRGTIEPQCHNLIEETRSVAVSSALRDERFNSVTHGELPNLIFEVSVLHAEEPVASMSELDPSRYGIVVRTSDGRRGLMLPEVEGLDTPEAQVAATRRKAGISPQETIQISRFKVDKFMEERGMDFSHPSP